MNKIPLKSAALILIVAASSSELLAQTNAFGFATDRSSLPSAYIAAGVTVAEPDDKFGSDKRAHGFGLRVGVPVSPIWDLQLGTNYNRYRDGALRYQQNTVGIDALYLVSRSRFRPFLMLGAGAEYNKVNSGSVESDRTSPYISGGAGIQMSLTDRWGMQADFRRAHSFLSGDSFPFKRANTNTVSLGVTYALGKPMMPTRTSRLSEPVSPPMPAAVIPAAPAAIASATTAPTPAPAPPPLPPPQPRFEKYTLSSTELFAFDSSKLPPSHGKLDEISTALTQNPQIGAVLITGYTDRLGGDNYNLVLSQERADAVKSYLASRGVAVSRLMATGKGEINPVVMCTQKNRADLIECLGPNRRVEVDQIVIERRIP